MTDNNLFVINKDNCPNTDEIIYKLTCSQCQHYKGFELYNAQPCIKCSFYKDIRKS